ncbi:MAG: DUF368 domain-containing protein [Actinomycetota bacterium]
MLVRTLLTFVRGFCMGAADIVPGVSGGTVALVLGIYERLLDNVRRCARAVGSLAKADIGGIFTHLRSVEWSFLLPLVAGVGAALVALASLIEGLLDTNPEEMAGLFFGLVAGSIVVAWGLLRSRTSTELGVMLAVGAVTFVLLGFQSGPASDPSALAFFGAGAIAICAMILPGISGSFLLLMMGMYAAVLGAAHDREAADLVNLAIFAVGAVIGIALFSTALGKLLDRHHDRVLAVLIGLMIGSFRVLWPWPNGVGIISDVEGESISGTGLELPVDGDPIVLPVVLAVVAFIVVIGTAMFAPRAADEVAPGPVPSRPV